MKTTLKQAYLKQAISAGTVVKVVPSGNRYNAWDKDGNKLTHAIYTGQRKDAYESNKALKFVETVPGKYKWEMVSMEEFDSSGIEESNFSSSSDEVEIPKGHKDVLDFIHSSYKLKPKGLIMNELKWKYLIRTSVRGKNIMITGPSGSGKTMAAYALVNALERPNYYFNMGATQDPRSSLIGNTHYNSDKGTYVSNALFVEAIQTPNAVILLDELTRAHPDAWNILMTVLDEKQRYLRIDEHESTPTIKVAEGVCFVATANIGNEYTATRALDRALRDRFTIIEMDVLNKEEELELLKYMFPNIDNDRLSDVAQISSLTRNESSNENPRIESGISTRTSVEIAGLLYDGFALKDAAEITIYPQYDSSGGVDSERTFVMQIVQKFIEDGTDDELFEDEDNLFNEEEMEASVVS